MITIAKFDTSNNPMETQWNKLFRKAWNDLATPPEGETLLKANDKDAFDKGKNSFSDLRHYLSYIEQLLTLNPMYLMLPIDETPFRIDTNTREIEVPPEFKACSGVQSDNYAEIITFTVDRYFDYKDLCDADIAVQWRNAAGAEGISIIQLKDYETYEAENKLRFGWPLTKEMTAAAGPLQFAVRFFTRKGKEFNYLLNTTVQSILIKSTLELKDDLKENRSDYDFFKEFVKNSQNPYYGEAGPVIFYELLPEEVSLGADDTQIIEGQAVASDLNPVTYEWYYISRTPYRYSPQVWPKEAPQYEDGKFYTATEVEGEPVYTDFVISETNPWPEKNPGNLYVSGIPQLIIGDDSDSRYKVSIEYKKYAPKTGEWLSSRPGMNLWKKIGDNNYVYFNSEKWPTSPDEVDLYVQVTRLTIKPGNEDVTGVYYVKAINGKTYGEEGIVNSSEEISNFCEINPPGEIILIEDDNQVTGKFLKSEEESKISLKLEHDTANPVRIYSIYCDGEAKVTDKDVVYDNKNNYDYTPEYTVSEIGTYSFDIKSTANRIPREKTGIGSITFYAIPESPSANMFIKRDNLSSINVASEDFEKEPYNGSYKVTTIDNVIYHTATFGTTASDQEGTLYSLTIKRDDNISIAGNDQTISFQWEKQMENGKNELITPTSTPNNKGSIVSLQNSDDGKSSTLTIRVQDPDAEHSVYKCTIINTIDIANVGKEVAQSDIYIFTME